MEHTVTLCLVQCVGLKDQRVLLSSEDFVPTNRPAGLWEIILSTHTRLPVTPGGHTPISDPNTFIFMQVRLSPWHGLWFYNDISKKFPKTTNGHIVLWNEISLNSLFCNSYECCNNGSKSRHSYNTHAVTASALTGNRRQQEQEKQEREEGRREFKDQKTDVNRLANSPSKWLTHVRESFLSLSAHTHVSMLDWSFAPRQYHP